MRAITTATAAETLGVDRKLLDGLLARLQLHAVPKGRQGLERRIPVTLLPALGICATLCESLGMPVRDAHRVAAELLEAGSIAAGPVRLQLDPSLYRADLERRLSQAIETVVRPRRGRPPRRSPDR